MSSNNTNLKLCFIRLIVVIGRSRQHQNVIVMMMAVTLIRSKRQKYNQNNNSSCGYAQEQLSIENIASNVQYSNMTLMCYL